MIAPAPISAAARPTWAALSESSARARSNSFPTSFASCANASLTRSGIERLFGELIAISSIVRIGSVRLLIRGKVRAAIGRLRNRAGAVRRTLQEPHRAKAGEYRQSQKGRRLAPRECLRAADEVAEIAGLDLVRDAFDLRRGFPDVGSRDRKIVVEFPRRAAHRLGQVSNVIRAGVLLAVDRLLELVGCLRRHVLGRVHRLV